MESAPIGVKIIAKLSQDDVDLTKPPGQISVRALLSKAKQLVEWKYFEICSGIFIMFNCITLMADHYPWILTLQAASTYQMRCSIILPLGCHTYSQRYVAYTKDALVHLMPLSS